MSTQVLLPPAHRAAPGRPDEALCLLPHLLLRVRVARATEDDPHLVRPQLPGGDPGGRGEGNVRGGRLQEDRGKSRHILQKLAQLSKFKLFARVASCNVS